jgi:hypothetical protein
MMLRPILSDMMASGILTQEEKAAIISYLGPREDYNEEAILEASKLSSNPEQTARILLESINNVVPNTAKYDVPDMPVTQPAPYLDNSNQIDDFFLGK